MKQHALNVLQENNKSPEDIYREGPVDEDIVDLYRVRPFTIWAMQNATKIDNGASKEQILDFCKCSEHYSKNLKGGQFKDSVSIDKQRNQITYNLTFLKMYVAAEKREEAERKEKEEKREAVRKRKEKSRKGKMEETNTAVTPVRGRGSTPLATKNNNLPATDLKPKTPRAELVCVDGEEVPPETNQRIDQVSSDMKYGIAALVNSQMKTNEHVSELSEHVSEQSKKQTELSETNTKILTVLDNVQGRVGAVEGRVDAIKGELKNDRKEREIFEDIALSTCEQVVRHDKKLETVEENVDHLKGSLHDQGGQIKSAMKASRSLVKVQMETCKTKREFDKFKNIKKAIEEAGGLSPSTCQSSSAGGSPSNLSSYEGFPNWPGSPVAASVGVNHSTFSGRHSDSSAADSFQSANEEVSGESARQEKLKTETDLLISVGVDIEENKLDQEQISQLASQVIIWREVCTEAGKDWEGLKFEDLMVAAGQKVKDFAPAQKVTPKSATKKDASKED